MLLTDKVSQFATDSNTVHAWVNGPASGIGSSVTTSAGLVRTPAKLIADKSVDVDNATSAAIAGNISIVNTVASNIGNVNAVSAKLPEVQTVVTNLASVNTVSSNIANVNTVSGSIDAVDAAYNNMAVIQASPANAFIASESAAYISTFVDAITLRDMAFPLDLGLIVDPVPLANTFDLGAL
mgnify:CR=1 FL=1